jgi:hypothetical protein
MNNWTQADIVTLTTDETMVEPKNFQGAWNHTNPEEKAQWREAIDKEFKDMTNRKVWTKIQRQKIPAGRRCVKQKWVFKIKRNGVHRARLVACGYSQIPGIDHDEVYAPVVNDVTYRIVLLCMLIWKLTAKLVDVETAFLHGELEGIEIYMDCPQGLEHEPDECLLLNKTIYGLAQSARQFYKKLTECLRSLGFTGGNVDPCLMQKKIGNMIAIVAIYVDDCLFVGNEELIQETVEGIKNWGLQVKIEDDLSDYLSCKILFSKDRSKAWLGQPHLIKSLEDKFGDMVRNLQTYRTPGTPNQGIIRAKKDEVVEKVDEANHTLYRSGVGMLLYLVKHSRPDIANAVRELSKMMDGPTPAAMKELKRVIKFVLDTQDYGLKLEPEKMTDDKWILKVYTDSDWAGDKDTRLSVTGYVLF